MLTLDHKPFNNDSFIITAITEQQSSITTLVLMEAIAVNRRYVYLINRIELAAEGSSQKNCFI